MSDLNTECDENNVSAIAASVKKTSIEQNNNARGKFPTRAHRGGYNSRIFRRTRGEEYRQSTDQQKNVANKKIIHIPSTKVGKVIGRGGVIIRNLELQTEAKIIIGVTTGDKTNVTLLGSDAAIAKVEKMINELTTDTKTSPKPQKTQNEK